MHLDTLKAEVCGGIAAMRGPLLEISHGIHDNPELAFEEHHAHRLLTRAIRDAGLAGGRAGSAILSKASMAGCGPGRSNPQLPGFGSDSSVPS
ncbi:MAG TPA: hypothetical protein VFW37_05060 [Alphaproteobacteria bacterium]|nr:hypothetical protein [Alphaproteobacteria bacterium]